MKMKNNGDYGSKQKLLGSMSGKRFYTVRLGNVSQF